MTAIARISLRGLRSAFVLAAAAALMAPLCAAPARADDVGSPVVVLKNPIAGDIPNIDPPARVVVYSSGLVIYRPKNSSPITAASTTVDYRSVQLSRSEYDALLASLPLKEAYRQQAWVNYFMPQIITFNNGAHPLGVEAANFTQFYAQPSALARWHVFHVLDTFHRPGAAVYYAPTYSMHLYPTTPQYSPGRATVWPSGFAGIDLPSDAANGAPRTDKQYVVTISGDQYRQAQGLLGSDRAHRGLVSIDGRRWLLEFTPHLPGDSAWGGNKQVDFQITRDAIHGDIPDDYTDW